ncbi:hypothetical protein BCR34DRAFT_583597 [Clohesyomyces aquaticus]|uniref:Uncharacterized protein n=1 Tax=Clohesyomyces aquaticus TaxID=1231657 RepID=A0A1Y2A4L6_9PLEO|nr:hypothetical protein BCR34DRAFT_583597 [Clohesyomyces aquaticus]
MGNNARSSSASGQTEGLPTPPPSPWQATESTVVGQYQVEVASPRRQSHSSKTSDTCSTPTADTFSPGRSLFSSSSTPVTPESSSAQSSTATSTSVSTTTSSAASIPQLVNVQVFPSPVTYPHQLYGTYQLGCGRRGAISGPSSNYYEGKYDS